jgi:succinyl-CoA synthetase beta subunit
MWVVVPGSVRRRGREVQISGMLWGANLLNYVGYPTSEVRGPDATGEEIKDLIDRYGSILIKPIFKGGIGKKGKAGLIGRASDVASAMREKERLFFVEHRVGNTRAKAEGVTFEGAIPAEHEIYVSITDDTRYRAPTLTITHHGGVDIEELPAERIATIPFDALTGFKGFIVANALDSIDAPREIISPLVQNLPKLWDLFNNYGMSTLELNPIRMMPKSGSRLIPVACDFKCAFDTDDPAWRRLNLPASLESASYSAFELEVNELRTYQGQSDVFVINEQGTITAMTFGGGANALVTRRSRPTSAATRHTRRCTTSAVSSTSTGWSRPTCSSSSAARPITRTSTRPSVPRPTPCATTSTAGGANRCSSSSGGAVRT